MGGFKLTNIFLYEITTALYTYLRGVEHMPFKRREELPKKGEGETHNCPCFPLLPPHFVFKFNVVDSKTLKSQQKSKINNKLYVDPPHLDSPSPCIPVHVLLELVTFLCICVCVWWKISRECSLLLF